MFKKIVRALSGNKSSKQAGEQCDQPRVAVDTHDLEKYNNNLKTINYQDLLDFVIQEEIYKIRPDQQDARSHITLDQSAEEPYQLLEDHEDDPYPITIEEEYRFVLVKKAQPKPTLVMPTKILKQLQDPSDNQEAGGQKNNSSS